MRCITASNLTCQVALIICFRMFLASLARSPRCFRRIEPQRELRVVLPSPVHGLSNSLFAKSACCTHAHTCTCSLTTFHLILVYLSSTKKFLCAVLQFNRCHRHMMHPKWKSLCAKCGKSPVCSLSQTNKFFVLLQRKVGERLLVGFVRCARSCYATRPRHLDTLSSTWSDAFAYSKLVANFCVDVAYLKIR